MAEPEARERSAQRSSEDPLEASRMTLGEHLEELRTRIIRSVVALFAALVVCWIFHNELGELALRPLHRAVKQLNGDLVGIYEESLKADLTLRRSDYFVSDDPAEVRLRNPIEMPRADSAGSAFMFYMKVCFYFAFFFSGAYVLWQAWLFVAAGLYTHEKRLVLRYFPFSVALFFGGILFGYFVMVPFGYYFLARMGLEQVRLDPKLELYFSFLKSLSLALGLVFQLPIFMLALARLGLVQPAFFHKYRGHFILLILVVAAVLTPPDPFTQMMMAIPMWILYEVGIVLGRLVTQKARSPAASGATRAT